MRQVYLQNGFGRCLPILQVMTSTNGDDENNPFDDFEFEPPDDYEDTWEEDRERVGIEWCKTVRQVGEAYRDNPQIEEVSNEFGVSEEEAREAATVYQLIFENPPDQVVRAGAVASGADFYCSGGDLDSMFAGSDETDSGDFLREFVGAVYRNHDVEEVELKKEISEDMGLGLPSLDFGFDFSPLMPDIIESTSPLFNDLAFAKKFGAASSGLARSIQPFDRIPEVAIMSESIPRFADQLGMPESSYSEIANTFSHFEDSDISPAFRPGFEDFPSERTPPSASEEEGLIEDLEDITEEDTEDVDPKNAIQYSAITVVQSLSKPNAREWYISASNRTQTTLVRALLFVAALQYTGGNLVHASAASMVLGPGLAAWIKEKIESETED